MDDTQGKVGLCAFADVLFIRYTLEGRQVPGWPLKGGLKRRIRTTTGPGAEI